MGIILQVQRKNVHETQRRFISNHGGTNRNDVVDIEIPAPRISSEQAAFSEQLIADDGNLVYKSRPWEEIASDVAIAVKTGLSVAKERIPKHRDTWWKRIPNLLLISDVGDPDVGSFGLREVSEFLPSNMSRLLGLDKLSENNSQVGKQPAFFGEMTEGFVMDSKKNLPGFLALYKRFPSKKWYIMMDDDTFIFLDNLALTLQMDHYRLVANEQPLYLGNPFIVSNCDRFGEDFDENGNPNPAFAHGGSGIVLSGAAMEKIAPHIAWCIERWDVCKEEMQPFFYHETPSKYFEEFPALSSSRQGRPEALPVSFHHIKGALVDAMLSLEKDAMQKDWLVTYADLAKKFAPEDFEFP